MTKYSSQISDRLAIYYLIWLNCNWLTTWQYMQFENISVSLSLLPNMIELYWTHNMTIYTLLKHQRVSLYYLIWFNCNWRITWLYTNSRTSARLSVYYLIGLNLIYLRHDYIYSSQTSACLSVYYLIGWNSIDSQNDHICSSQTLHYGVSQFTTTGLQPSLSIYYDRTTAFTFETA